MAQRRTSTGASTGGNAGVYAYLRDCEERQFDVWRDSPHARGPRARYPRQSRLDDLRAGRPITAGTGAIPPSLGGTQLPPAARRLPFEEDRCRAAVHRLVTVHADDRIVEGGEPDIREYMDL